LFVWIDLIVFQLKLLHNALLSDKTRDDFQEMKREIRNISEKLESQMRFGEEGIRIFKYVYCDFIEPYKIGYLSAKVK